MTSSMMRPGNFRHDMRGAGVVEISMAEYLRSKRSILKKIRRRLIILGIFIGLTSLIALVLGVVVATSHSKVAKFHREFFRISLRDLYFVYGGVALLFSFHGFYIDGHWSKMQKDGNRLVLHLRLYSLLGLGSCVGALWLGFGTLSAFGLVDVREIVDSPMNAIYLATLVTLSVHIIVTPWLLRTVHRKANQADEYFGAEFVDSVKRSQRSERSPRQVDDDVEDDDGEDKGDDEGEDEDNGNDDSDEEYQDRRSVVLPATSPHGSSSKRGTASARSPMKNRHAFYGPDGSSHVAPHSIRKSPRSPRVKGIRQEDGVQSPRPRLSSPRSSRPNVADSIEPIYEATHPVGVQESYAVAPTAPPVDHIPYASPVFVLDPQPRLQAVDFWRIWKISETTGSFSCPIIDPPHPHDVRAHLQSQGFHVVAVEATESALQVYFYAFQLGSDVFFVGEFVFLFARRFFQATFKCKIHDVAPDFVARFQLQELRALAS